MKVGKDEEKKKKSVHQISPKRLQLDIGDTIFGFFCFLVCFAMFIAHCWIISVMFLFRLSTSSGSSSAVKLFFSSS